jgi:purine-binding chemotaxis protein CheW
MTTHPIPAPGRFLTFHLGSSYYGVPIREVREVVRLCPITGVPNMPAHIRGVINLRGAVLPVFDLRAKFGMAAVDYDDRGCIVVFDRQQDRPRQAGAIGAIVDGVDDVLVLTQSQLASAPDFAGTVEADYLLGVGTTGDRVFSLLHMKNILAADGSVHMPAINPKAASGGNESL